MISNMDSCVVLCTKGGFKSEGTNGGFLLLQKIFQITILSRKFEFPAQKSKRIIQIFRSVATFNENNYSLSL